MSLKERKVGKHFRIEGRIAGQRIRLALGTQNRQSAHDTVADVERALREGAESAAWMRLRNVLPEKSFASLAEIGGYREHPSRPEPTWTELQSLFEEDARRRIALRKFRESTLERYRYEFQEFGAFLAECGIGALAQIDRSLVERYKVWRVGRIRSRSIKVEARSLPLCAAILHRVFAFAVENELAAKNPVRLEGKPGADPERGAQPFKPEEIRKLREHAGPDALIVALLRWTGFRVSDAVALTWAEVDWDALEVVRVTQKRTKRVVIPIHTELLFALEAERDKRKPQPWDRVLLNPVTGQPFTRGKLRAHMLALGRRAGVVLANPHRFRDSLAVEMLCRGASPYDVAKILGDTIETVEQHYAPFVPELRARVRRILESEPGENLGTIWARPNAKTEQVQ